MKSRNLFTTVTGRLAVTFSLRFDFKNATMSTMTTRTHAKKFVLLAFLFYAGFHFSLTGNTPLDVGDDITRVSQASHASWEFLSRQFLFHWKLSDALAADAFVSRIGETVILKIIHSFFGPTDLFYYLYQIFIGALCAALLTGLTSRISGSAFIGFLAGVWYTLLPSTYVVNTWLADFAEHTHFLILLMIYLTIQLHDHCTQHEGLTRSGRKTTLVAWILLILYLAVRIKANAFIYPITIVLFFAIFFFKKINLKNAFYGIGLIALGCLFLPWEALSHLDLHPENAFALIIQNNLPHEFEIEKNLALLDISSVVPASALRSVGFLMSWIFIFSLVYLMTKRSRIERFPVKLALAWFLGSLLTFFLARNDLRYVSEIMIPLILLLGALFMATARSIQNRRLRILYSILTGSALLITFIDSTQNTVFVRHWKSEERNVRYIPMSIMLSQSLGISRDELKKSSDVYDQLSYFWDHGRDVVSYCDINGMEVRPYDVKNEAAALKKYGHTYWIAQDDTIPPAGYTLISNESTAAPSALGDFLSSFKNKKRLARVWTYRKSL